MKKIAEDRQPHLSEHTWKEVRSDLQKVNPKLVAAIDEISPNDSYTIFKASYPYGSMVIKRSDLQIPNNKGAIVPLTDPSISDRIKDLLGYNKGSNPVCMLLKNSMELFISLQNHTVSASSLITPGSIFGAYIILTRTKYCYQPAFIWDMTAGARSIFMLPKISETEKHNNLRRNLGIHSTIPKLLIDHWQIFKEIADCESFAKPWNMEAIFFSKKWFERLEDEKWRPFHYFLLRDVWDKGDFWRNNFFWNLIFTIIQKDRNLKPSPYISDTVKYLLAISTGAMPGFAIAQNNLAAPIADIQKAYLEIYNLKDYLPIIMLPGSFDMDEKKQSPVYYSLQFPNAIELGQNTRARTSLVQDLYEIRWLMDKYLQEIALNRFNIQGTPLSETINKVQYEYFHDKIGNYSNIKHSEEIFIADPNFKNILTPCHNKLFPANSPFVRGCIRISKI